MSNIRIEEHVVVPTVEGNSIQVDIFWPQEPQGPVAGLLFLPGGGWRTADRGPLKERYGLRLAERGMVCVAGSYRVMDEAPWPAQIQDVKATIRWMRANHERLGIHPAAIAIGGKSAGGHLALLAAGACDVDAFNANGAEAAVSSEVAAAIGIAPVSDLSEWAYLPRMEPLFGSHPSAETVQAASPLAYVGRSFPPTLLIHGTADETVPHAMTHTMYAALERSGVPVDLQLYAGQDHFFDREPLFSEAIANAITFFMARYVSSQDVAVKA